MMDNVVIRVDFLNG